MEAVPPKFTKFMAEPVKLSPGSSPLDTPGYFVAGILKGYLNNAGFAAECAPLKLAMDRLQLAID
jgi:hypothetical protein